VCVLVVSITAGSGHAAQKRLDLQTATRLSDVVLHGRVLDAAAKWVEDDRGRHIYTYATVRTLSYAKGSGPSDVVVELPGGTVGSITESVSETVAVTPGEEVVLLLKQAGGLGRPAAGTYSKYRVELGEARGVTGSQSLPSLLSAIRSAAGKPGAAADNGPVARLRRSGPAAGPAAGGSVDESRDVVQSEVVERASVTRRQGHIDTSAQTLHSLLPESVSHFSLVSFLTETFEGLFPGGNWELSGTVIPPNTEPTTWLDTSYMAHTGYWSGWCAGTTQDPANGYVNNMDAWMVHGPFSLTGATDANVTFWYNNNSQSKQDWFYWTASTDGTNFNGYRVSGNSGGWKGQTFDLKNVPTLGNLCGRGQVWIAFVFQSNASVSGPTYKGTFIDDIQFNKETNLPAPTISSINPGSASGGTGTPVTITGTNFGSNAGTVQFAGGASASIVSWSNGQIVCTVPSGASSGPVTVTADGGASNGYTFIVTFSYGGVKWPGTPVPPVPYRVNPTCRSCSTVSGALQAGANAWNNAGSAFQFQYNGTTTATTSSYNGVNENLWGTVSSPGIIALTTTWYSGSNILEVDTVFNDVDFTWSTTGASGSMDVQTIATHELGHWLLLDDLYGNIGDGVNDTAKIMYGYADYGLIKRTLHATDQAAILWVYGPPPAVSMTFSAATGNIGSHANLSSSNYATVTYIGADGSSCAANVWDASPATVLAQPNSTYSYSQASSGSTSSHRWYCNASLTGTVPASGSQTVGRTYYEQYKPTVTLDGTNQTRSVSTEAHDMFGAGHLEAGLYGTWSDWCDAGGPLAFSQSTTGTPPGTTSDPCGWTVTSSFSATIRYKTPGDANGDGYVDASDVLLVASAFGSTSGQAEYDPNCDFNDNGVVDVSDLLIVAGSWGT